MLEGNRSSRAMPSLIVETRRTMALSMSNFGVFCGLRRSSKSCAIVRPLSSNLGPLSFGDQRDCRVCLRIKVDQKVRAIARLDPFFQKTSKLASRRLKREIERRGTPRGEPLPSPRSQLPHLGSKSLFN